MSRRRIVRGLALAFGSLATLWLASGLVVGAALTERAAAPFAEPAPEGYEDVRLRTSDGVGIGAWIARADPSAPAIVLAHGIGGSRSLLRDASDVLHTLGCTVLPITLRAHGDSDGERNDVGWSARHDVVAAVDHLRGERPDRPVVVLGVSMGAAAALFAGSELGDRAAGYVLVAPYADLGEAIRRRTSLALPPPLADVAFAALWLASFAVLPELGHIRPEDARTDRPALFLAGSADVRAPPADARRIAVHLPRARVVELPGVDHDGALAAALSGRGLEAIRALLVEVGLAPLDG